MTSWRGDRIYAVFVQAEECDPSGRSALLDKLCADEPGLRAEVERLLAHSVRAHDEQFLRFADAPPLNLGVDARSQLPPGPVERQFLCPCCCEPIGQADPHVTDMDAVCPSCGAAFRLGSDSMITAPIPTGSKDCDGDPESGASAASSATTRSSAKSVAEAWASSSLRDRSLLDRPVALKLILAGQFASEAEVRRFYREAKTAANLDHPGIVPIYEVGQHEGQHYFSMGWVEGRSLAATLNRGRLECREAAALVAKVAEAIEYAHGRGVVHRDIKPANILLDARGNPRVTDFGLAKRMQSRSGLTASGQLLGTPEYMAPEQAGAKRGEIGPSADVYSLGATLYNLVTGRPPFQSDTPMGTLHQVLNDEPSPPRRLNPTLPLDLETICLKCLEKAPSRRVCGRRGRGRGSAPIPGRQADRRNSDNAMGAHRQMGEAPAGHRRVNSGLVSRGRARPDRYTSSISGRRPASSIRPRLADSVPPEPLRFTDPERPTSMAGEAGRGRRRRDPGDT